MTDQEIIHQLKKGNEACLKQLYQHLGMIKGLVLKNNGNEEDALDIFQEAVIVFYKNVMSGGFELKGKISSYLYEVSRRLWLNQLNRRRKIGRALQIPFRSCHFSKYENGCYCRKV